MTGFAQSPLQAPLDPSDWPDLEPVPEGEPRAGAARGPLLLVDDDPDMLSQAASILGSLDVPLLEATNGPRALSLALRERPRLVLLDAMLPGLHGFEVCRELKATPETKDIPVILCSALYSDWRVHEDAKKSFGAEAFLAKPFQAHVLVNLARDLLFGKHALDPLAGFGLADAREGRRALERGEAAEAARLLTSATRARPYWPEGYFYLGLALEANGQPYPAASALERAAELKPDFFACLEHLAGLYERVGLGRAARGAWERAMKCCPTPERQLELRKRLARLLGASDGSIG